VPRALQRPGLVGGAAMLLQVSVYARLLQPQVLLAILGGAALGYIIVHLITNVGVRATGGKVIPGIAIWFLRILGAIVGAWAVAMLVLGLGGSGFGGSGGGKLGEGTGDPFDPGKKDERPIVKDEATKKDAGATENRYLRVEVLMNDEMAKSLGPQAVEEKRFYREEGARPEALLTLKEVREKLHAGQPPFKKLYIVLGKARSDPKVARVEDLAAEARGLKIPVEITAP